MELSSEPGAVSALIGLRVRDQSGRSLGRVRELRGHWEDGQLFVEELLIGRRALLRRLRGPGPRARAVPWAAIVRIGAEELIVHDSAPS
jgi:sporulation protein YlmC with PRC-barrel domain